MSSSILAAVQKDIGAQSRDYTQLVRKVKDILPQYSDDVVCEALIQTDEDVMRAVDLLLSAAFADKAGKKRREKRDKADSGSRAVATGPAPRAAEPSAEEDGWGAWGEDATGDHKVERSERPKTEVEKHAARLRKKLREIERIEDRLKSGDKVDPLQLPKIDKKNEVMQELAETERKVREEERQREEERRQQEEERRREEEELRRQEAEVQRRRLEAEAAEEALRQERERRLEAEELAAREREAREAAEAEAARQRAQARQAAGVAAASFQSQPTQQSPQSPPGQQQPQQAMGMELLSMLHQSRSDPRHGYQQSKQMADELSGGRGPVLTGQGTSWNGNARGGYSQSRSQDRQQEWHRWNDWSYDRSSPKQKWRQNNYDSNYDNSYDNSYDNNYGEDTRPWGPVAATEEDKHGFTAKQTAEASVAAKAPEGDGVDDFASRYSTPLDISRIPPEKRAEAERIANEIENGLPPRKHSSMDVARRGGGLGRGKAKGEGRAKGEGKEGKGKGKARPEGMREDRSPQKPRPLHTAGSPAGMASNRLNW